MPSRLKPRWPLGPLNVIAAQRRSKHWITTDDPEASLILGTYWAGNAGRDKRYKRAINLLSRRHSWSDRKSIEDHFRFISSMHDREQFLLVNFHSQIIFHVRAIQVAVREINTITDTYGPPPVFPRYNYEVWERIFSILSHSGSIYWIFKPTKVDNKRRQAARDYRQRVFQANLGLPSNYLSALKDARDAIIHLDNSMDEKIELAQTSGKKIIDLACIAMKDVENRKSYVVRCFDPIHKRIHVLGHTIRLSSFDGLIPLLMAITNNVFVQGARYSVHKLAAPPFLGDPKENPKQVTDALRERIFLFNLHNWNEFLATGRYPSYFF